jgi:hypothetical protein
VSSAETMKPLPAQQHHGATRNTSEGSLWSDGQSSGLQIQRSRVPFPTLPDFLRSCGSGTRSTQPREYNREAKNKIKVCGLSPRANYTDRATAACQGS